MIVKGLAQIEQNQSPDKPGRLAAILARLKPDNGGNPDDKEVEDTTKT